MKKLMIAAVAALVTLLPAAPAMADVENWNWIETRVPLSDGQAGAPSQLRVFADSRYGLRYPGLGWLFLRVGPIWNLHPNWFLATHYTTAIEQTAPGAMAQEHRIEIEPNFFGRLGDFTYNDRNRLEYRYRVTGATWRYRNQLRFQYQPEGATWAPFVWDEALVDLSGQGFNQNRAAIGLAHLLNANTRVDAAYILRSRLGGGVWEQDHVLNLTLCFTPGVAPIWGAAAGGVAE
ncbi:MAG: DUF2490 domain-containing protein [Candidatus Sericytochromatia bacterium]